MTHEIVVHHLETSRSHRVLWLLHELDVPFRMVRYPRTSAKRAPKELKALHPLGKSPLVQIDGVVFAESGPILEELLDRFGEGRLRPEPGTDAARAYRYWMHFAEGSLMPPLIVKLIMNQLRSVPWPARLLTGAIAGTVDKRFTDPEIASLVAFVDAELAGRTWLCGDQFTAADIQMAFPCEAGLSRRSGGPDAPHLFAWLDRCKARPAYQKALKDGGPVVMRS